MPVEKRTRYKIIELLPSIVWWHLAIIMSVFISALFLAVTFIRMKYVVNADFSKYLFKDMLLERGIDFLILLAVTWTVLFILKK